MQHCPAVKILELYPQFSSRALPNADAGLAVPVDVPKDLADRVNELAKHEEGGGRSRRRLAPELFFALGLAVGRFCGFWLWTPKFGVPNHLFSSIPAL